MAVALKAPAKTTKKAKKAQIENWVFDRNDHTNKRMEGVFYKEYFRTIETTSFRTGKPKKITYNSYSSNYRLLKGRSVYKITKIKAFDKKGIVFEFSGCDLPGHVMYFKDCPTDEIKMKKKEDFSHDAPYIVSQGRRYNWEKEIPAHLYVPIRYFKEIGYKIEKEVTTNKENYVTKTKWILKTKYFDVTLYSEESEDFEAQKKKLIQELRKLKKKKDVSRKDVVELIEKYTTIYVPDQYRH